MLHLLLLSPLVAEAKKPKPAPPAPPMITGTAAGQPFAVVRAFAMGDPAHPGVLTLMLADRPMPCGEVPPSDATLLAMGFEPVAGSGSVGPGMLLGEARKLFAFVPVAATLVTLPEAAGGTGTVRVASLGGEGNALAGEATFELCEVVKPAPPPEGPFEERVVALEDGPAVKARVPTAWKEGKDPLGDTIWTAQDGATVYRLSATCGGACDPARYAENAERWQSDQTSGYASTPGYRVELGKNELVSDGTRVVRYTIDANGAATSVVAVLRWAPSWDEILVCELKTPAKNAAILDAAEQACLATTSAK